MKLSIDWLSDYITWTKRLSPEEFAAKITASVAEVDAVEHQGALLEHCCVGAIKTISKHPDASKLQLCDVATDQGVKRVVCGGSNLREGMRVAFAHVGATVRCGKSETMTLEKIKIRGEHSEGMLCASCELELEDLYPEREADGDRPIIDLGDEAGPVGTPLREYLDLTDTILHIDNHAITHRADLFSHIGFARECVALGLGKWKKDPTMKPPKFTSDPIPFQMKVKNSELMPRYCACAIAIDGIGQTPDWMIRRLAATGWRSVSLPVDITNYVMMEVGVPLHSFDAGDIVGDVTMRQAKEGEEIITLDGATRALPEGSLILEDSEGIFDLLGIMGGLRSSTKKDTRLIYLHSANLAAAPLRKAMIATGLRTDAGTVYEKGVPAITAEMGFYRAAELMCDLIPGAKIVSMMDSQGDNGNPKPIELDPARVCSVLGIDLTEREIISTLEGLEFTVNKEKELLSIIPPLHRLGDISGPHDLVEEVGRTVGYDRIPPTMPTADITPPERDTRLSHLRCMLKNDGWTETLPLSLISPDTVKKSGMDPEQCREIENPLGAETSLLQPSLLPVLLEHGERVVHHAHRSILTFTHGTVFPEAGTESRELGLLLIPHHSPSLLEMPILRAKRAVIETLAYTGYTSTAVASSTPVPQAHPGRSVDVVVGETTVGSVFELKKEIASAFSLPDRTAAAIVDLDALFALSPQTKVASMPPQYPNVTYDLTCEMDHKKSAEDLLRKISATSDLLTSVQIKDLYEKPGSPTYSLTLQLVYQSLDRTLTEEEVKKEFGKVEKLVN